MKHILFLVLLCFIVSGCAEPLASNKAASGITDHDQYNGIKVLVGTVSFRIAPDGVREIVLHAKNNTKNNLWVPYSSMGVREMSGTEAVNLREIGPESMRSIHHDYSLCKFPDQYEMLKPGHSWEYIHALPNDFQGEIEISVWAPLRTDQGDFASEEQKMKVLKDGEVLIEEIKGTGRLKH